MCELPGLRSTFRRCVFCARVNRVGGYVLLVAFTAVKLRGVHDAYGIKRILPYVCVYGVAAIMLSVLHPDFIPENPFRYASFPVTNTFLFHNLTWQVYQTRRHEKRASDDLIEYDARVARRENGQSAWNCEDFRFSLFFVLAGNATFSRKLA